ncbi:DDE family transposase [Kitasatospora cineracea]|uniref:DDE family transposase n=1 Tax=Kitasatospora cineracea TaxID=88074 RepID=A0A8G1XGL4_9ACTN|nr:DDE family transposase [Kitasatospora cineracea]
MRNEPCHKVRRPAVQLTLDLLLAWIPMLALTSETRRREPKRLRLRLFSAAAHLVTTGRRPWLRLCRHWSWIPIITSAYDRLRALLNPG